MPAPNSPAPHPTPPRPAPGAVERLYVYWLVSTGLLLLVMLIVAILMRGTIVRQAVLIGDLSDQVADLQQEIRDVQAAPRERVRPDVAPLPREVPPSRPPPETPPVAPPPPASTTAPRTPPAPEIRIPADSAVRAQLEELVSDDPKTPSDVTDPQAAAELVESALRYGGRAQWSGSTWLRLATLARLLGHDAAAEIFAEQGHTGGEPLVVYEEVSVRSLLARGHAPEALPIARRLSEHTQASPTSQVLLAATHLALDDLASADEVLETLPVPVVVHTYDKLLLARVLLALEHWPRLGAVLSTVRNVPPELNAEYSYLLALADAYTSRTVEALAILDGLLGELPPGSAAHAVPGTRPSGPWPWPQPDRYDIEAARGLALLLARQAEAARQVLQQAAELDPRRADADYNLGLLEAQARRSDLAKSFFKNALARSPQLAGAWEALAALEINDDHVEQALPDLAQAVRINIRRASTRFLMAIAHAKLSQKELAAEALRITFQLDENYLAEAKQADVLLRLFTSAELDELATEPTPAGLRPERPEEQGNGR
jgi:tetratricopeptide (TPR) repeat protein